MRAWGLLRRRSTVHRRGAHPSSCLGIWGAGSRERTDGGVVARPDTVRARCGRGDSASQQPWPAPPRNARQAPRLGTGRRRRGQRHACDRPRADRCRSLGEAGGGAKLMDNALQRHTDINSLWRAHLRNKGRTGAPRSRTAAAGSRWGSAVRGGKAAPPNPAEREHHRVEGQLSRRRLPRRRRLPGTEGRDRSRRLRISQRADEFQVDRERARTPSPYSAGRCCASPGWT